MLCYCQSQKTFDHCCAPIHKGERVAATAEELMRSRYSAFVVADINYLMRSHHVSTRPVNDKKEMLRWTKSVQWMGLQIVSKSAGQASDTEGHVEFRASYLEQGQPQCIYENSYFVKEKGLWYYKSGVHR